MTAMPHLHLQARARQAGMTLIELLISITIGLFIIGAALMVFQSTSGVGSQITELTQLRQQGMHAFRVIGKQIREAGAVEPEYVIDNNNFRFNEYKWEGGDNKAPIVAVTAPSGASTTASTLGVSQQVQTSTAYIALVRNCLGQQVTSSARISNFYVNSENELMCMTGANPNGQPIVANIHDFQVRYRVRPNSANTTTKQFVTTPSDWKLVDAVEVCIDLVGSRTTPADSTDTLSTHYTDCAGQSVSRNNRLHVVQRNLFTVFSAQR